MFFNKKKQRRLSAYLDGELTGKQKVDFVEQLAFDAELRSRLADFAATDSLVRQALAPAHIPAPSTSSIAEDEEIRMDSPSYRHLKTAAFAAAGLLVTAGITFASLRRRGIV